MTKLTEKQKKRWNYMLASVHQSNTHNCVRREFYDTITEWLERYRALMEEKQDILEKYSEK